MRNNVIAPALLVLAVLLLFLAAAMISKGPPQPDMELHRARIEADEAYTNMLERRYERRCLMYKAFVAGLITGGLLLGLTAFLIMRPS